MIRRYLAYRPSEVGRVFRLLDMVTDGCPGHGPIHLQASSAANMDSHMLSCARPGLPALGNLAGPIQHCRSAVLSAWQDKVAADLCARSGFRGGPLLDVPGTLQLLASGHVRERDESLLKSVLVGGVWKRLGDSPCHAGSVVVLMVMVTFSGNVLFSSSC